MISVISIILDVLIVAIVAVSAFFAYRKGFIKTLFSLLGGVIAIVLAISFSAPVASWLDAAVVGPAVRSSVLTAVNGAPLTEEYDAALESVDVSDKLLEMPESLRSFLESLNIDVDEAMDIADKNRANSVAARQQLIEDITAPITATISKAIALIVLIVVFFLLLFIASLLLNAIFKLLPFGKSFNHFGGLIVGLIRGVLFVMIFGLIVHWLAYGNTWLTYEDIDNTWILKWINAYNPILSLFK